MTFAVIRRLAGGFHFFNLTIKKMLRDWTFERLERQVHTRQQSVTSGNLSNYDGDDDSGGKGAVNFDRKGFARLCANVGRLMFDAGRYQKALSYQRKSLNIYTAKVKAQNERTAKDEHGHQYSIAHSSTSIAKTHVKLGALKFAEERFIGSARDPRKIPRQGLLLFEVPP